MILTKGITEGTQVVEILTLFMIPIILIILFFAVMTYAFGAVIVATLIRIGVINTDKKTILNKTKNTIIITAILIASMSLFLGQMLLVKIFVVLAIVISIMFLIIENFWRNDKEKYGF